jgi:hypothetical protein
MLLFALAALACEPLPHTCIATVECAFGSNAEFANIMTAVAAATADCTQPPPACSPYLERFALLPLAECSTNAVTKQDIARVCNVNEQPFLACMRPNKPSPGARAFLAAAAAALAIAFLGAKL